MNSMTIDPETELRRARTRAREILASLGIDDPFTVKLKDLPAGQLARYRALSQFRSRPMMWISTRLPQALEDYGIDPSRLTEVIADSILHEYGHVIAEFLEKRAVELRAHIDRLWPDEEDFAEAFAHHANGNKPNGEIAEIVTRWVALLEEAYVPAA